MWDAIDLWWLGIAPPIKGALVGALATVSAATFGAIVVFRQIGRQARNAIDQNRINEATKLKLEQYRAFTDLTRVAGDEVVDFMSRVARFVGALNTRKTLPAGVPLGIPPAERAQVMVDRYAALGNRCVAIIAWVERWNIIDPRLDLFQRATNVASHDVMDAWIAYFTLVSRVMARDMPGGGVAWNEPTDKDLKAVQRLSDTLNDRLMTLSNYLSDFEREMQNLLLGDLFRHQLSPRQPMDPRMRVVTLARYDDLMKHFNEETPWAKAKIEAEERVRKQLAAQAVKMPTTEPR
jgi:hypothetical protein